MYDNITKSGVSLGRLAATTAALFMKYSSVQQHFVKKKYHRTKAEAVPVDSWKGCCVAEQRKRVEKDEAREGKGGGKDLRA